MKFARRFLTVVAMTMLLAVPGISLAESAAEAPKAEAPVAADAPKAEAPAPAPAAAEAPKAEAPAPAPAAVAPAETPAK